MGFRQIPCSAASCLGDLIQVIQPFGAFLPGRMQTAPVCASGCFMRFQGYTGLNTDLVKIKE